MFVSFPIEKGCIQGRSILIALMFYKTQLTERPSLKTYSHRLDMDFLLFQCLLCMKYIFLKRLKRSGWQMVKPLPTMKLLASICSTTFYLYSITNIVSELCRVNGKSKDALVLSIHRT